MYVKTKKHFATLEIFPTAAKHPKITPVLSNITNLYSTFRFGLDYIVPVLIVWVSFSNHNPTYLFARGTYNYEQHHSELISIPLNTMFALATCFVANVVTSTYEICILSVANGIVVLYLWSVHMVHVVSWTRADFPFDTAIKMYKNLGVMTILQLDLDKELVTPVLHHFYIVTWSTMSLYYFLLQFVPGKGDVSLVVSACCVCMILGGLMLEMVVICFGANASKMSREFLRVMKEKNGKDKYRMKVLKGLLPNSINLEVLGSAETMRTGIGMDYFLSYVDRVTSSTVDLLLTDSNM